MFSIDGTEWSIPCSISRVSTVESSEISGYLLNGEYFNDAYAQYLQYSVKIAVPVGMESEYADLYQIISEPVDGHRFVFPYNEGTISITGRVESISDVFMQLLNGDTVWTGIKFDVIANHPTRQYSLDEMIARGRTPLPELDGGTVGDSWVYTDGSGWVHSTYDDVDNTYY